MNCINVNLSVLQCMQDNFVEHIISIVESYDIPKSLINFEITESVSASDYRILSDVVGALKKNGFQFSMDDYGTGYSNMHSLFSLAFDIVKIDKSILWDSEESSLGEIILENCVHMIRQMGRKVLVEGVETKEHADKLKNLGVDYLQGFYFSRPIPKNEFLQLIS
jgi:EAL domain-containing protein (putative c-di-GMP-specific phosphodiesterase class I)